MDDYNSRKSKRTIALAVIILIDLALVIGLYFHDHRTSKVSMNSMPGMNMQDSKSNNMQNMPMTKKTDTSAPKDNLNKNSSTSAKKVEALSSNQLVNTGPGDVLLIFGVVSLVTYAIHYLYYRKFSISDR